MMVARGAEAGVTLVEVIVALGLGSLIAIAGFSVLDTTLSTQSRMEGRLERLAQLRRAVHLIDIDLQQISGPPIIVEGPFIGFRRHDAHVADGTLAINYMVRAGTLQRSVRRALDGVIEQDLISDVRALSWQVSKDGHTWIDPDGKSDEELPLGIRAEITLGTERSGPSGVIHRIVRLPTAAQ